MPEFNDFQPNFSPDGGKSGTGPHGSQLLTDLLGTPDTAPTPRIERHYAPVDKLTHDLTVGIIKIFQTSFALNLFFLAPQYTF